jgi:hypothetical protein
MVQQANNPVAVPPGGTQSGVVSVQDAYGLSPKGWRDYLFDQIDAHDKEFDTTFTQRGRRIVARYRDERGDYDQQTRRYNVLWANTQTLLPAVTGKGAPVPVSQRRFMDADPAGRVASTMIERVLRYQFDRNDASSRALKLACWDWLVPGMGTVWVRYEPGVGKPPGIPSASKGKGFGTPTEQGEPGQMLTQAATEEKPAYEVERTVLDYVFWEDFGFQNARVWDEVGLVWRKVYLTRDELKKRFNEDIANKLPCSIQANQTARSGMIAPDDQPKHGVFNKACVYEVWDKQKRTVSWISRDYDVPLDVASDPLKLPDFFPCPRPLFANTTTGNLKPVAFYAQYQDQAVQLDILSQRIAMLTKACKLVGVYDASQEGVQRMLNEAVENQLIPVDTWAAFAEKGGVKGVMDWLPIDQVVSVLKTLGDTFEALKGQVYEITGIGEIMRGASTGGTAAEARMQEQYISVRLDDLRQEFNRFCDDAVGMMGHIICTLFREESIIAQSGIMQTWDGQQVLQGAMPPPQQSLPPPSPPPGMAPAGPPPVGPSPGGAFGGPPPGTPGMGMAPPGPPPGMGPPGMGPPGMPPGPPPMQPPMQPPPPSPVPVLMEALQLLRDTPMSDFRVRVDVESFIDDEIESEREQRIAFLTALTQFMQQALPATQENPALAPLMNALLLFNVRTFKAGREMEGQIEQSLAQLAASPPPPDKPDPKAQAEQARLQAEVQKMQAEMQLKQQEAQAKLAQQAQEGQLKLQQMQQEGELRLRQMEQEFALKIQMMQGEQAAKAEAAANKLQIDTVTAIAGEQRERAANEASQARAQEQHDIDMALKVKEGTETEDDD